MAVVSLLLQPGPTAAVARPGRHPATRRALKAPHRSDLGADLATFRSVLAKATRLPGYMQRDGPPGPSEGRPRRAGRSRPTTRPEMPRKSCGASLWAGLW